MIRSLSIDGNPGGRNQGFTIGDSHSSSSKSVHASRHVGVGLTSDDGAGIEDTGASTRGPMHTVDADALETFGRRAMTACGTPTTTAEHVAASLVDADLVGHTSHGVVRLPTYASSIDEGATDPTATPVVESAGPFHQLRGGAAFGQLVGREAVDLLVETAADRGVGVVGIRDSGHLGRIGEWAERVAAEGFLFAGWVNLQGGAQRIAPHGSADRRLGTNPLTFAVPAFGALPFDPVYDGATSQVAHGKIIEREGSGDRLPEEWTIAASGEPVERAAEFEDGEGALLPLGGRTTGYKGFGLATMVELFAATVGDGPVPTEPEQEWTGNGGAFLAIDPACFTTPADMERRLAGLAEHLRSADTIDGATDEVMLPGEPEYRTREHRTTAGIPLRETVVGNLQDLAAEYDIADSLPPAVR